MSANEKPTNYAPQLKPPCTCAECAARHGDQAPVAEEVEVARLRDEVANLKADLASAFAAAGELNGRCAHWRNEAEVLASRRNGALAERDGAIAEAAAAKRERDVLRGDIDRVTLQMEAEAAAIREAIAEHEEVAHMGNVLCGLAFDIERANYGHLGLAMCAYCGVEGIRRGAEMQAHIERCAKHPMAAAVDAEREACAKLAEDEARFGYRGMCHDIANGIRARGGK